MIEAYPLHWPVGYKRTQWRKFSAFKQSMERSQQFLKSELNKLGAINIIVSTNIPLRKDGMMYAEFLDKKISDPGVALYFKYKNKPIVMCCDQYERVWENIYALGKGIEALRGMERWGVSEFMERAFTGFKALPETTEQSWSQVLGLIPPCSPDDIKNAYRKLAQIYHPDAGGNTEQFNKINKAYMDGLNSLK